jgi:uncharacterized phiE125 gp8 family phage protein
MATKIITAPTFEPLSVADVSEYLRLDDSPTDTLLISALITAARQHLENYLNRYIAQQTVELALTGWSDKIDLSAPLQSVSSVKYLDVNGVEQTLAANQYVIDNYSEPAVIYPAYNVTYPNLYDQENNVKIRYVVGFTSGGSPDTNPLPDTLKFAMMLIIGDLYSNREAGGEKAYQVNPTVQNLLQFYRLNIGM